MHSDDDDGFATLARSHSALSAAPSAASSELALDSQPASASTSSSSPSPGWSSPSTRTSRMSRSLPCRARDAETGSIRRRSLVDDDDEADDNGAAAQDDDHDVCALGDPAPKRWRRMSKLQNDQPGLERAVESIDLSHDLDGEAASDPSRACDFAASQPAPVEPLASPAGSFASSPSTPDMACAAERAFSVPSPASPDAVQADAETTFPLGRPTTKIFFCRDDQDDLVPPCFFPGQTIPTLVVLELPRYTCLPHSLAPSLSISLVGTLRCPPSLVGENDAMDDGWTERILINVGVGLQDGMDLWQKDATIAWERLSEKRKKGRSDPSVALPGGKYTLPLTVQVPSSPTLPPSFNLASSTFAIAYHLSVTLSIDDPEQMPAADVRSRRMILSRIKRDFSLLPTTLPTLAPDLAPVPGLLEAPPRRESFSTLVGSASAGWLDKFNSAIDPLKAGFGVPTSRSSLQQDSAASSSTVADVPTSWSVVPSLPTATFSPSSVIPIDFRLQPPTAYPTAPLPTGQLVIKAALIRREFLSTSAAAPLSTDANEGLLSEEEIISCVGRHDLAKVPSVHPSLPRLSLPLGLGAGPAWSWGFSTSLSVSPGPGSMAGHVHCASRFFISLEVAFAPTGRLPPATDRYVLDDPFAVPFQLASRIMLIPVTIGSVGEPPGANRRMWRELYLGRHETTGEERPQVIDGASVDRDEAWILAPPSYEAALAEPAYAP